MKTVSNAKKKGAVRKFVNGGTPGKISFWSVKPDDVWEHKFVIHFIT